eukprot:augustus_masked-scaffold_1-processed-gene-27.11-mRNA-1 protein AED:1.00 eAED:1.00 QI:0/-1/0/0/-1/1/1/0/198
MLRKIFDPYILTGTKEIVLFDTSKKFAQNSWVSWTDKIIGGYSEVNLEFSEKSLQFSGVVDTKIPEQKTVRGDFDKIIRSGFSACKYTVPNHLQDLTNYPNLSIRLKSDGKRYKVNVIPESYVGDDLYQGYLEIPDLYVNKWVSVSLPFESFVLLGGGKVKALQRALDYNQIQSIGFSIDEGQEGPFSLQVSIIKATI